MVTDYFFIVDFEQAPHPGVSALVAFMTGVVGSQRGQIGIAKKEAMRFQKEWPEQHTKLQNLVTLWPDEYGQDWKPFKLMYDLPKPHTGVAIPLSDVPEGTMMQFMCRRAREWCASPLKTVHQNLPKSGRLTDFEAVPVSSNDDTLVVNLRPNGTGAAGGS